jgi:hypothetical protein
MLSNIARVCGSIGTCRLRPLLVVRPRLPHRCGRLLSSTTHWRLTRRGTVRPQRKPALPPRRRRAPQCARQTNRRRATVRPLTAPGITHPAPQGPSQLRTAAKSRNGRNPHRRGHRRAIEPGTRPGETLRNYARRISSRRPLQHLRRRCSIGAFHHVAALPNIETAREHDFLIQNSSLLERRVCENHVKSRVNERSDVPIFGQYCISLQFAETKLGAPSAQNFSPGSWATLGQIRTRLQLVGRSLVLSCQRASDAIKRGSNLALSGSDFYNDFWPRAPSLGNCNIANRVAPIAFCTTRKANLWPTNNSLAAPCDQPTTV